MKGRKEEGKSKERIRIGRELNRRKICRKTEGRNLR